MVRIETTAGIFAATFTELGLAELSFPGTAPTLGRRAHALPLPERVAAWAEMTLRALDTAVVGRPLPALPPLDWSAASDFQRQVWTTLLQIPPGATRTYSEVAAAISSPAAARAVGTACGANPIPVLVPCHRVLASGGGLGGFSGGLPWKRKLLAAEGVLLKV